jgi:hypothetical protein
VNFLLAWTLPDIDALQAPVITDNDNRTRASRAGRWRVPSSDERAADFYQADPDSTEPYVYAETIREPLPGQPIPLESRFTWRSGPVKPGYYRIRVHIPAQPTKIGQTERPYARSALYLVTTGAQSERRVFLNQAARGGWIQLGDVVYHNGVGEIVVTLTNLVVRNSPDYDEDPPRIVVADAVEFVPDYGTVQASPVAIRSPLNPVTLTTTWSTSPTATARLPAWRTLSARAARACAGLSACPTCLVRARANLRRRRRNFTAGAFTPNNALGDRYGRPLSRNRADG